MRDLWCGIVGSVVLVFDPDIQSSNEEEVTLFSSAHDRPVKLQRLAVRNRIRKCHDETAIFDGKPRVISLRKANKREVNRYEKAIKG